MFGRLDLLKRFGGRKKAFCKYAWDFLNLGASKKKKVPVRHTVDEDTMC